MRERLVVGNWKMNGSLPENQLLLDQVKSNVSTLRSARCAVCVPFPFLAQAQQLLSQSSVAWGAQNVSQHPKGAYTGEVSAGMLNEFGTSYVIVGHSERRTLYGEDDALVAAKFRAVKQAGMRPILCVGETLSEREAGRTEAVVGRQLRAVAEAWAASPRGECLLAYEPVWAIGTGRTASPDQAQAVHSCLRTILGEFIGTEADDVAILYGGSVKAENAAQLFAQPDIDGGLIGGASLIAKEFIAICRAAYR